MCITCDFKKTILAEVTRAVIDSVDEAMTYLHQGRAMTKKKKPKKPVYARGK